MKAILVSFCLTSLFLLPALGQDGTKNLTCQYEILPGSKVTVSGSTNVNEFSCFSEQTISNPQIQVSLTPAHDLARFKNAVMKIKIASLECGHSVMNDNLCSTLKAEEFPYIMIELTEVRAASGKNIDLAKNINLIATVSLTIAGAKKVHSIYINTANVTSGVYHFSGMYHISLSSYGIKPPHAFFGLVKVNDNITVKFDLRIKSDAVTGVTIVTG